MSIRLVVADDHPLILVALQHLFGAQEGCEVVAACTGGAEALAAVRLHRPDILILDLQMPGMKAIDLLREMAGDSLPTRTVLLAEAVGDAELVEALRLGVRGVVLKEMPAASVVLCVRKVHAGEPWLENRSAARALGRLARGESGQRSAAAVLTQRELEIVRMLARGLHNKSIASLLSISEHTVKVHLSHVYAKLGLDGRLALMRYAEDKGIT